MNYFFISSVLFFVNNAFASNSSSTATIIPRSLADIEDPKIDWTGCGRPSKSSICDPDQILSVEQANVLDAQIADIISTTKCACSAVLCRSNPQGYTIGVALIKKMIISTTVPDQTKSRDVQVVQLNAALSEAKEISQSLLLKWNLGQCHDGVIVFFSSSDSILYTAVGSTAGLRLTDDLVGEISMNVRLDMNRNVSRGIQKMLTAYKSVFMGTYKRTTNWDSTPDASAVVSSAPAAPLLTICSPVIKVILIVVSAVYIVSSATL